MIAAAWHRCLELLRQRHPSVLAHRHALKTVGVEVDSRTALYGLWWKRYGRRPAPQRRQLENVLKRQENLPRVVWWRGREFSPERAVRRAPEEFHAVVDEAFEVADGAEEEILAALLRAPGTDVATADHDTVCEGLHCYPSFTPEWNPTLLRSGDYLGGLAVFSGRIVEQLRHAASPEGRSVGDWALAAAEGVESRNTLRIPRVLAHRSWSPGEEPPSQRPSRRDGPDQPSTGGPLPSLTVVVPTRRAGGLPPALAQALRNLDYPGGAVEVLVIHHHDSTSEAVSDPGVRVLPYSGTFDHSRMNNQAVAQCQTEMIALVNDDVVPQRPDWLRQMVAHATRPQVGAVGAKLLYPDGRVQHGGVLLGGGAFREPVAGHLFHGLAGDDAGYMGRAQLTQELSAVTAACVVLRREVFLEVGGFDEVALPVAFNDVDLCLRLRQAGYKVVWTPLAVLHHEESATLGKGSGWTRSPAFATAVSTMRSRWGSVLEEDPAYNPNLDRVRCNFDLAFPPRTPWTDSSTQ